MSTSKLNRKTRGQALVELAIILPILVLFMSAVTPLIVKNIASSWLDERLALRHFGKDDHMVQQVLARTHEADQLPPYFEKEGLEESIRSAPLEASIPLLPQNFPGKIYRIRTTAKLQEKGWWNRSILHSPQEEHLRLSKTLSMVPASYTDESQVPGEVRRLTLLGLASGTTSILDKAGLDLFHLNLDALPETAARGKDK